MKLWSDVKRSCGLTERDGWRARWPTFSALIRDPQVMWVVALLAWPGFLSWAAIDYAKDGWWVAAGMIGTTLGFAYALRSMRLFFAWSHLGSARNATYKTKAFGRYAQIAFYAGQSVAVTRFVIADVGSEADSSLGRVWFRIAGVLQLTLIIWSSLVIAARRVAPITGNLSWRKKSEGIAWGLGFAFFIASLLHGFEVV